LRLQLFLERFGERLGVAGKRHLHRAVPLRALVRQRHLRRVERLDDDAVVAGDLEAPGDLDLVDVRSPLLVLPGRGRRGLVTRLRGEGGERQQSEEDESDASVHEAIIASRYASACAKSSMRSFSFAMPTETRISASERPMAARSSALIPTCDIAAGRETSVSTPPRLGAWRATWTRPRNRCAAAAPPFVSKLSIPPKPSKSSRARAWRGCVSRPG